jgi:hypothetical protein
VPPFGSSLTVCANLSAKEFQQPDLADNVAETLNETGLSPCSLNIEITESLSIEDAPHYRHAPGAEETRGKTFDRRLRDRLLVILLPGPFPGG